MNTILKAALLVALAHSSVSFAQKPAADAQKDTEVMLMLVPVEVAKPTTTAGCWAKFYDQREYKGEGVTMTGPVMFLALDKSTGRYLHRNIDSLEVGPKATLTVYQHRMFKDRSVSFGPSSREPGLIKKLGFTGRIESMKLDCTQ